VKSKRVTNENHLVLEHKSLATTPKTC